MQTPERSTFRCAQFVQIPVEILADRALTSGARDFASQLLRWDWGLGCSLTDTQLAEELGCSSRTIQNYTRALVKRGHLWCFEDREGMAIRLVRRPGGIHPRPKGLPAPIAAKKFSNFHAPRKELDFNNIKNLHGTTDYQPDLSSVPVEDPPASCVADTSETPTRKVPNPPNTAIQPEYTPNPTIVKVMVDAGVDPSVALDLARTYPAIRCWDGVEYVERKMEHGETISNPGGYIRRAIENGWRKLGPMAGSEATETAAIEDLVESDTPQEDSAESPNQEQPEEKQISDDFSRFEVARRNSLYAGIWGKAREIMRNPENLDVWVNPHAVSRFLDPCYLERTGAATACLFAPGYAIQGAEEYLEQVQEALRLAGFSLEITEVIEWEDSERRQAESELVADNLIALHPMTCYTAISSG